jgi:organic anion transporter 3A
MTGLYSEAQDDSSADLPQDTESDSMPSTVIVHTQNVIVSTTLTNPSVTTTTCITSSAQDTVIKCHSRQPSAGLMDREKSYHNNSSNSNNNNNTESDDDDDLSKDCGILSCRPAKIQKLARIKVSL